MGPHDFKVGDLVLRTLDTRKSLTILGQVTEMVTRSYSRYAPAAKTAICTVNFFHAPNKQLKYVSYRLVSLRYVLQYQTPLYLQMKLGKKHGRVETR